MRIAFIGAGRMAEALIARLTVHDVTASDIDRKRLEFLRRKYKIRIAKNNLEAFHNGRVVILAVKPQQMAEVLNEIKPKTEDRTLIISIAAGIPLSYLQKKLPGFPIIRAMPNNPCLVGAGITALAKGKNVTRKQYQGAKKIFESVGEVLEVPEKWMDAVTGLSGSGPAFVYQVIEALTKGGMASGLPRNLAVRLALRMVAGAVAVIQETGKSPQALIRMVASPGGTTMEGLKVLKKFKLAPALAKAVIAAAKKSKFLSRKWTL